MRVFGGKGLHGRVVAVDEGRGAQGRFGGWECRCNDHGCQITRARRARATLPGQCTDAPFSQREPIPFGEALRFWLRLGFISFGGPAGQIAIMHRELVEQRHWISEKRFLHALNYCMLLPGPEAQQLATYIGWLMHRTWGGIAAGALFVLPSLFILIALSWAYVAFGNVPWVAGLFYGIKPAVAAIVLQAVHRIGSKTLKTPAKAPVLWVIALLSFVAIAVLKIPFPWVVLGAALTGWIGSRVAPRSLRQVAAITRSQALTIPR